MTTKANASASAVAKKRPSPFALLDMIWWTRVAFMVQRSQWALVKMGMGLAHIHNFLERRKPGIDRRFNAAEARVNEWNERHTRI